MSPQEVELREKICHIGRLMHQKSFLDGAGGNISARLGDNQFLITPSTYSLGFLTPEHLVVVNRDGERVDEPNNVNRDFRPTSETPMHLECYRQRDDVNAVVHAHPKYTVALTIAGYDFKQFLIPEVTILLGLIPVTPYATPSSTENRDVIQDLIADHDVILLAHHGSLTVASDVWHAYMQLETLEHTSEILYLVETLGGPRSVITPEQVKKLLDLRRHFGLLRSGDEERFAPYIK